MTYLQSFMSMCSILLLQGPHLGRCICLWLIELCKFHAFLPISAGFSSTVVVPMCDGRMLTAAVRRINVGGKALTNYFKELVSYRQAASLDVHTDRQQEKERSA